MLIFETIGYKAPFKFLGIFQLPSTSLLEANPDAYYNALKEMPCSCGSCAYCGTGIIYNYIIKDADGRKFAVGCDCIERISQELVSEAKKARKELAVQLLINKKAAATRARHDAERVKNGGLTDAELYKKNKAAEWEVRRAAFENVHGNLFADVRETGSQFGLQMIESCMEFCTMSDRQKEVLVRIVADFERKQNALNEYFGNIGDRVEIKLTTVRETPIETQFGTSWIVICADDEGRTFKYFGKSTAIPKVNESAIVKFTIGDHEEYNGVKQTKISRPTKGK
jgi:hypothetical protein